MKETPTSKLMDNAGLSELPPPFHSQPPAPAREKDEPPSGFKFSLALHVGLAAIIFLKTVVFPGQPIAYIPSLRVDLVGLPDQLKSELKNPAPLPVPGLPEKEVAPPEPKSASSAKSAAKTSALEPDEVGLKKSDKQIQKTREKRMESALARIKALAKISGDSSAKPAKPAAAQSILGNKVSKGTSLSKDAHESDQANYVDNLQNALQQNWTLPMWLERQQLNAKVMIYIDANGRLIQFKFIQSSGNPQFDEAVKRTLAQSQPFPTPPAELASSLASDGVMVGFPL